MEVTEEEFEKANRRGEAVRAHGYAVSARFDRHAGRIRVVLNTGLELGFRARDAEGLAEASPDDLAQIEITPEGLGLHWPRLDADLYVPALLNGVFGSKSWMARELGASGGRVKSALKAAAARANGQKGGRPPKQKLAQG